MTVSNNNNSSSSADDTKVKVAVRVRPFNRREIELGTLCVVEVTGQSILLNNPNASSIPTLATSNPSTKGDHPSSPPSTLSRNIKHFSFDHCFWSFNES